MAKEEQLLNAVENNLISITTKERIEEYSDRLCQNNIPVIFNLRHLRKILHIKHKDQDRLFGANRNSYHTFQIPKKSGGYRTIDAPTDDLKSYQTWIKENILDHFRVSNYATGFKKACSIVDNASFHIGKELVINLDLKDFFSSITYQQVYKVFSYIGYTNEVSHLLSRLCTNNKNALPQGSPASPTLSNLVSLKLDKRLSELAKKIGCEYSRYADDITFSGSKSIKSILPLIYKIICEEGYTINDKKVRLQYSFQRQEVTGLIVNSKLSISHKLVKEIENAIYYCKEYSVADHMKHILCNKSFYKEHLYGIAYFIKMVDIEKGQYYLNELDKIAWSY